MKSLLSIFFLMVILPVSAADYKLETVADGLDFPWSVAFLPGGELIVAERSGSLRRISADGGVGDPLQGLPESYVENQGGYHDVVLHPDFASNQLIYLAFAHGSPDANGTRIVRGRLTADAVEDVEIIFTVEPLKDTAAHYGGKLLFLPDGKLLLTTGDGFDYREEAQNKDSQLGKTIRINDDGSVPADNPFAGSGDGNEKVFTWGHRNPQGLTLDTDTGTIYLHEHGPRGGDELNRLAPGKNYGWPAITYGMNYSGAYVSPFTEHPSMEQPLKYWVPSVAPSGLAYYDGDAFPQWKGDLFVGTLVNKDVRRLDMENGKVVAEEILFAEIGERIRDVRVGPDGFIYILTDSSEGKIIRVVPKSS
ncbi:MAG: PQQ-dependent sugar dehydrogenase [Proteobacteria bacterium]|nr:PQQ-dependent sugar dehydrogenase [Pseudomonadota bacterium]